MRARNTQSGATLLEVVIVVAISALVIGGVAAQFRTLRQVTTTVEQRREALQRARVAFDRMSRVIRQAKSITAISPETDPLGSITVLDFSDQTHVFQLLNESLYYGSTVPADRLLAEGFQELRFEGFDADGAVAPDSPGDIDAVRITATVAIPGTTDTMSLSTFVRLRRQVVQCQVRNVTAYATQYQTTLGSGLQSASRGLYAPDGKYARLRASQGGRYYGFGQSKYVGPIYYILAGFRMRYLGGSLRVVVRKGWWPIYSRTFSPDDLAHVKGKAVWWWIDLTDLRYGWDETDIPDLSIEVRDPTTTSRMFSPSGVSRVKGKKGKTVRWRTDRTAQRPGWDQRNIPDISTKARDPGTRDADAEFDCFAIRAFFDPPPTLFVRANREGKGTKWPNQWSSPEEAFGEPDDAFAIGQWATEQSQAYRTAKVSSEDEIISVQAYINGYISVGGGFWGLLQSLDESLRLRVAKPNEKADAGVEHSRTIAEMLDRIGYDRRGDILFDVTNDRKWTWRSLDDYEIRIKLDRNNSAAASLRADAVGWRVTYLGSSERGVSQWVEQ